MNKTRGPSLHFLSHLQCVIGAKSRAAPGDPQWFSCRRLFASPVGFASHASNLMGLTYALGTQGSEPH